MKSVSFALFTLFFSLSLPDFSWAQGACIVSSLEGQATVLHDKDQPRPVNKFKKLWPGDQLELSRDTIIRLNYLALGRVEQWKGPARIILEEKGGRDQANAQQPTITTIGVLTTELKNSKLLNQQNMAGQMAIRGSHATQRENVPLNQQENEKMQQIQKTYNSLLQQAVPGDVTPELYYLAGLELLGQKETMARHIHKLLSMQGSNADLEMMLSGL